MAVGGQHTQLGVRSNGIALMHGYDRSAAAGRTRREITHQLHETRREMVQEQLAALGEEQEGIRVIAGSGTAAAHHPHRGVLRNRVPVRECLLGIGRQRNGSGSGSRGQRPGSTVRIHLSSLFQHRIKLQLRIGFVESLGIDQIHVRIHAGDIVEGGRRLGSAPFHRNDIARRGVGDAEGNPALVGIVEDRCEILTAELRGIREFGRRIVQLGLPGDTDIPVGLQLRGSGRRRSGYAVIDFSVLGNHEFGAPVGIPDLGRNESARFLRIRAAHEFLGHGADHREIVAVQLQPAAGFLLHQDLILLGDRMVRQADGSGSEGFAGMDGRIDVGIQLEGVHVHETQLGRVPGPPGQDHPAQFERRGHRHQVILVVGETVLLVRHDEVQVLFADIGERIRKILLGRNIHVSVQDPAESVVALLLAVPLDNRGKGDLFSDRKDLGIIANHFDGGQFLIDPRRVVLQTGRYGKQRRERHSSQDI